MTAMANLAVTSQRLAEPRHRKPGCLLDTIGTVALMVLFAVLAVWGLIG